MPTNPGPHEIALSAAWHAGHVAALLTSTEGQTIEVVHRGTWSHGQGPDFQDALLLFDGHELRAGSIEMHLRTRGWIDHGHDRDAAYDTVVLHVVAHHDGTETRRSDGAIVPVLELGEPDRFPPSELSRWAWDQVGGAVCAEDVSRSKPAAIRALLARLGDLRLAARSARIEALLQAEPAAQVLWTEILDGLGFSSNRVPMRALAQIAPIGAVEDLINASGERCRLALARGLLFGIAGFLPLSPAEAHLGSLTPADVAELETAWRERGTPWFAKTLAPPMWTRARVRPGNHPVTRLLSAANLLTRTAATDGLLSATLDLIRQDGDLTDCFRSLTTDANGAHGIGEDRAIEMLASGILPFAMALANHTGDADLADAASAHWDRLPAPAANAVTRRAIRQVAGSARLGPLGARGAQGLIHLDTTLCQPRRCFECPIAAAALSVNGT